MEFNNYLQSSEIIDWRHPQVQKLAVQPATGLHRDEDIARDCFEWVRDTILHSNDYKIHPITLKASGGL